jgi:hypothetical protein
MARDSAVRGYESIAEIEIDMSEERFRELHSFAKKEFHQAKLTFTPLALITSITGTDSSRIADASHAIAAGNVLVDLLSEIETLRAELRN